MEDTGRFTPWLSDVGSEIQQEYSQSDMMSDKVMNLGIKRVYMLVMQKYDDFYTYISKDSVSKKTALLSYPVARILVSIINDARVTRRFSAGESELLTYIIKNELKNSISTVEILEEYFNVQSADDSDVAESVEPHTTIQSEDIPSEISQFLTVINPDSNLKSFRTYTEELTPEIMTQGSREIYRIPIHQYVSTASNIKTSDWKLEEQHISNGWVFLSKNKIDKLLEKKVEIEVSEDLPLNLSEEIESKFLEHAQAAETMIPDEFREYEIDEVKPGLFPPVIDELLDRVNSNQNVIHEGRFTLGSFLVNIGLSTDEIVEMLGAGGEFYEEQTRYQINHIRNSGDDGEPYTPPTYQTIESWGIEWEKDSLEEKVKHPLQYYSIKLKDGED